MTAPPPAAMRPEDIIARCYPAGSESLRILTEHGERVARKALEAAARVPHLRPDAAFIRDAAMLHDIGVFLTDSPDIGCRGREPYIRHGILGRGLLDALGLHRHGLVCERHIGVGISAEDIRRFRLPLPERDMRPATLEERIICWADKFFSKDGNGGAPREKPLDRILAGLRPFGEDKVERFLEWTRLFG